MYRLYSLYKSFTPKGSRIWNTIETVGITAIFILFAVSKGGVELNAVVPVLIIYLYLMSNIMKDYMSYAGIGYRKNAGFSYLRSSINGRKILYGGLMVDMLMQCLMALCEIGIPLSLYLIKSAGYFNFQSLLLALAESFACLAGLSLGKLFSRTCSLSYSMYSMICTVVTFITTGLLNAMIIGTVVSGITENNTLVLSGWMSTVSLLINLVAFIVLTVIMLKATARGFNAGYYDGED